MAQEGKKQSTAQGLRAAALHDNEKFMGRIIPPFLLLILAACVGIAPNVEGIRTVGIVSAIGDKFYARKMGFLGIGNDFKEMAIDSWAIDEMMTAKIRAALTPRFDVRPVTYRRAVFAAFPDRSGFIAQSFRPELVRTEVSPQGLDAYIVVLKGEREYSQTKELVRGLGSAEGNTDADPVMFVHAYYTIGLVDGHDFQIKRQAGSLIPSRRNIFVREFMTSPSRQVDASLWPKSLDAAANQRLKAVVVELIDQSLPDTLQRVNLVQ